MYLWPSVFALGLAKIGTISALTHMMKLSPLDFVDLLYGVNFSGSLFGHAGTIDCKLSFCRSVSRSGVQYNPGF